MREEVEGEAGKARGVVGAPMGADGWGGDLAFKRTEAHFNDSFCLQSLSIFISRYEHLTWECESAILKSFEDRSIACGLDELQPLYSMFVVAVYLFESLFHSLLITSSLFVCLPLHLS